MLGTGSRTVKIYLNRLLMTFDQLPSKEAGKVVVYLFIYLFVVKENRTQNVQPEFQPTTR